MRTKKPQFARSLPITIRRGGGLEGVPQLADRVIWTGSAKRPMVGDEKEELRSTSSVPNRVPGHTTIKTEPIRIVIADSHDLAYEYGKVTTEFDLKSGEHVKLEAGMLRVWQKQDGNWKEAAALLDPTTLSNAAKAACAA